MIPVGGRKSRRARVAGGTVDNAVIGGTTAAAATVTTLTATGAVALSPANANVVLSPTGSGLVTVNPATAGTMDNVAIGGGTPLAGAFTTLSSTGVTALKGSITNDSATAGNVGELITATVASASAVAISSATGKTITSISLTAGDWDVSGAIDFVLSGVTATVFQSAISASTDTLSTQAGGSGIGTDPLVVVPLLTTTLSATYTQHISPVRVTLAATTPIYLVAQSTFSLGTLTGYGTIRARRMR